MNLFDAGKRRKPILWVSQNRGVVRPTVRVRSGSVLMQGKSVKAVATGGAVALAIAAAILSSWAGVRIACRHLYLENPVFTLRNLDIRAGRTLTEDLIREYMSIGEGINTFQIDIVEVRRMMLEKSPNVRSIEITRIFPDTMLIEVFERVPLARVGRFRNTAVDSEGVVFLSHSRIDSLPLLRGPSEESLRPGSRLGGRAVAGLQVLEMCEDPRVGLQVVEADIRNADYVLIILKNGKSVRLAWDGMGRRSHASEKALRRRLAEVVGTLNSDRGRRLTRFDATIEGSIYGN